MFMKEVETLGKIKKFGTVASTTTEAKGSILEIVDYGNFVWIDIDKVKDGKTLELKDENSKIFAYVVMPRLGKTLDKLFCKRKYRYTKEQICSLGIQLLNILEQAHSAGCVYNDLKLDNLLFDYGADVKDLKNA